MKKYLRYRINFDILHIKKSKIKLPYNAKNVSTTTIAI